MKEMKDIFDYIEKYGDKSFEEKKFNEIDNVIFSQIVYNDFGTIVKKMKCFYAMRQWTFLQKTATRNWKNLSE